MQVQFLSATSRPMAGGLALACALVGLQLAGCSPDEHGKDGRDPAATVSDVSGRGGGGRGRDFGAFAKFRKDTLVWSFEGEVRDGDQDLLGWVAAETNPAGDPADWAVVESELAFGGKNMLSVSARNSGQTYNMLVAWDANLADLMLACRVRAISGAEDQGGGPMWRVLDANNYYVCRINPLEDNFRVYKVVDGVRTQLASADFPCDADTWYVLRVAAKGEHIRCAVGDKWLLEVQDSTFPRRGRVGVWTKADASTSFDGMVVSKLSGGGPAAR